MKSNDKKVYFSLNVSKLIKHVGFMFLIFISFYVFIAIYTKIQVMWGRNNLSLNMLIASDYLMWYIMPLLALLLFIYAKKKEIKVGTGNAVFAIAVLVAVLIVLRCILFKVFEMCVTTDGFIVWLTKKKATECDNEPNIILNPLNPLHAQRFMVYQALFGCFSFVFYNIVSLIKQKIHNK